jgi:hypothetical protein
MEKCIFVGYPSGYKAWQFYNPVTRKLIIAQRAIFDERSFPGVKRTSPVDLMAVGTPATFPDVPDSGGDDDFVPEPEIAPIEPDALPQLSLHPTTFQWIYHHQTSQLHRNLNSLLLSFHHMLLNVFRHLLHRFQLQLTLLALRIHLEAQLSQLDALLASQSLLENGGRSLQLLLLLRTRTTLALL